MRYITGAMCLLERLNCEMGVQLDNSDKYSSSMRKIKEELVSSRNIH